LDFVGVPVWMVVRPLAKSLSVSQGKGVTHELAVVSGIMESIEISCAEERRPPSHKFPLFNCVRDSRFVNPMSLPVRSDARALEDVEIPWVLGRDIISGLDKFVPEELFNLDLRRNRGADRRIFISSSNGLASGNTPDEAIIHAICELLERDQTSFWLIEELYLGHTAPRRVKVQTIADPVCQPIIEKCHNAGLKLFVWHIATTVGVPVFACTAADLTGRTLYPQRASGFGCHPWPNVALARALTEALQSRLTHIAGIRDDVTWRRYLKDIPSDILPNRLALKKLSDEEEALDFDALCDAHPKCSQDKLLEHLIVRLREAGLTDVIVTEFPLDVPELSVVHVCIPGIEYSANKPLYTPGDRLINFLRERTNKNSN
jgi:ribosomal protein S12 methylthiotransferase accessory factor